MSIALADEWFNPEDPWPDSDGKPMAENTEQYQWLVKIKENLEILFADDPDVFVAGDLFWYPQPDRKAAGDLPFVIAPDVMVVLGRPKGKRGSYKQWEENGIPPQVVFEILSPGNRDREMADKLRFFQRYGVQEYYLYDPARNKLSGWQRQRHWLVEIPDMRGWRSPLLGIRFAPNNFSLEIYDPHGKRFLSSVELSEYAEEAHVRAEQEYARAEQEYVRAEQERLEKEQAQARTEQERVRAEAAQAQVARMAEYMRKMGLNPDDL